jgi:hypothetical protein
MSDEPIRLPVQDAEPARPRNPSGLYEHYCEHPGCKKWGGWGFRGRTVHDTVWFCFEHRPDREPS